MKMAIFGATGQVGSVMINILAESNLKIDELRLFASPKSAGKKLSFQGEEIVVEDSYSGDYSGIDVALFSCGKAASLELAPVVGKAGAIVIDNSSAWRMDDEVPLVVPEVNPEDLKKIKKNIVANPNCTTMIAMPVLAPVRDAVGIKRVIVTSFQAVSGAGVAGVKELSEQIEALGDNAALLTFSGESADTITPETFKAPIAYNVVPFAGALASDGSGETDEEQKWRNESRKILGLPELLVDCTCVRVPVFTGHSLSLHLELQNDLDPETAKELLTNARSVVLADIPTPLMAAGKNPTFVGRIRRDATVENGLAMFLTGDNLRKGAALNTVQIAEELARQG